MHRSVSQGTCKAQQPDMLMAHCGKLCLPFPSAFKQSCRGHHYLLLPAVYLKTARNYVACLSLLLAPPAVADKRAICIHCQTKMRAHIRASFARGSCLTCLQQAFCCCCCGQHKPCYHHCHSHNQYCQLQHHSCFPSNCRCYHVCSVLRQQRVVCRAS